MLRKIVHMFMGKRIPIDGSSTYFTTLINGIQSEIESRFSEDSEMNAWDRLAIEVIKASSSLSIEPSPQAARVFLKLLMTNDQLEPHVQIPAPELELIRNFILAFYHNLPEMHILANQVMTIADHHFSEGAFSKAYIMLQSFHTDPVTRLNNERNLFYDDLITRLQDSKRKAPLKSSEQKILYQYCKDISVKDQVAIRDFFHFLIQEHEIHFCIRIQHDDEMAFWKGLGEKFPDIPKIEELLQVLPTYRWRAIGELEDIDRIFEQTQQHIETFSIHRYVKMLIRVLYFYLITNFNEHFEDFLFEFLSWSRREWNVEPKKVLPELHRWAVLEQKGIQKAIQQIYEDHYLPNLSQSLNLDQAEIYENAWTLLFERLGKIDYNEILPGYYDLGGLLLDQITHFEFPNPQFSFKLHKLS